MAVRAEPIDCRGLACPEPVLRVKAALDAPGEGVVTVLLDDAASRDNVRRFAESQGGVVGVEEDRAGGWRLSIARGHGREEAAPGATREAAATAILVTSDRIGPEPELGGILMRAFLATLGKAPSLPARLLFVNRGVHLTTEGSEVLDVLRELQAAGAEVLSCGTCLEFFQKRGSLAVGRVSNMYETVETLTGHYRVVTIS
jgi:selenium metabolism protein YedF